MRLFFLIFLLLTTSAHADRVRLLGEQLALAKKAIDYAERKRFDQARSIARDLNYEPLDVLIDWFHFRLSDQGGSFDERAAFIGRHPYLPRQSHLQRHAESQLYQALPHEITAFFRTYEPLTAKAHLHLARAKEALGESEEEVNRHRRRYFVEAKLTSTEERRFLKQYGHILSQEDYVARIDHLLFLRHTRAAKRLLGKVEDRYRRLFIARMRLILNQRGVDNALSRVAGDLRDDKGLIYDRASWRYRRGLKKGAYELLISVNKPLPMPKRWWKLQYRLGQYYIQRHEYARAYDVLSRHDNKPGSADFAEAEWLSGWLALRFMNDPHTAYKHFYRMYQHVRYPVSLSRASYWAARAAEANGEGSVARKWYRVASGYVTRFYGQLALHALQKEHTVRLPKKKRFNKASQRRFDRQLDTQIIYLLIDVGEKRIAERFIKAAIDYAENTAQTAFYARIGSEVNNHSFGVVAGKQALRNGVFLPEFAYPVLEVPDRMPADFTHAIIRQESQFDAHAKSSAGARGLMQLMPATARLVSRKERLRYALAKLTKDPWYNMRLGTAYLDGLAKDYDGFMPYMVAAYNAGPANLRRWVKKHGDIRGKSLYEVIDWMEHIPFRETRNYVQRVIENRNMYRVHLGVGAMSIGKDLGAGS